MIRQRIEDFGASKDMETNQHDIVGEQHESSELICDLALSKGVVSEVADIPDLWVFHDEFVHRERSDVEEYPSEYHCDDSRYPAQNGKRPCLCHDS